MSDDLPTIWPAKLHTRAKHSLLKRYLDAWLPIVTAQSAKVTSHGVKSRQVLFVDGFAGPGEYEGGAPGSPVIAIEAALNHLRSFSVPVHMLFIENREDRFSHLQRVLAPLIDRARSSANIATIDLRFGDCDEVLRDELERAAQSGVSFGPALAFLDQFGYGAVSMSLIAQVLRFPQCEVFAYLDYKDMNRWISDPAKAASFTRAFGGEEWRECVLLPEEQRRSRLLVLYKEALHSRAKAKYVQSFMMFDRNDQPLYWLVFCTNNLRGLDEMKKAMWSVDKSGHFRFSDRDNPGQLHMFADLYNDNWLAEDLRNSLGGKTLTGQAVMEHVLVNTPCYNFRGALKVLESDGTIRVAAKPPGRKPLTYPAEMLDRIVLQFEKRLF